jgi:hypothetical protein
MPIYSAAQLMRLRTVTPPAGKPEWANLAADVTMDTVPAELCGPGLYALFHDESLFYIGLHVGEQAGLSYSVLHRWVLHVVGQTMRSTRISFSRASLRHLLAKQSGDAVTEALALCLPQGRATDFSTLPAHPLLNGPHCTAQKAAFAARHWNVFAPGNEDAMLNRITCLFQPVTADWTEQLAGAEGRERGAWAREQWLRPAETALVNRFKPACNAVIPLGEHGDGICASEVEAAMAAALPHELPAFDRTIYEARVAARGAAAAALVEAYHDTTGNRTDPETSDMMEAEGLSSYEDEFRCKVSNAGSRLIDTVRDTCPPSLEVYFTGKPDLRIRIVGERRPLLLLSTAREKLMCHTRANADIGRRLGFADIVTLEGEPMRARFHIDPTTTVAGAILILAGAGI